MEEIAQGTKEVNKAAHGSGQGASGEDEKFRNLKSAKDIIVAVWLGYKSAWTNRWIHTINLYYFQKVQLSIVQVHNVAHTTSMFLEN